MTDQGGQRMKIDVNEKVRVRLTQRGRDIQSEAQGRLNEELAGARGRNCGPTEKDGWSYWPLSVLFRDFGTRFNASIDPPFDEIELLTAPTSLFTKLDQESTPEQLMRLRCDSQSMNYYGDLSRYICRFFLAHETLSLLDVGPRTGSGLALLRLLHHPSAFTRLKLDPVVGIDIDPAFDVIASKEFPDIRSVVGDIFNLQEKSFDVVTCSHTIEHIETAEEFVRQLEFIARRAVFIACPFEEKERVPGHVRSIDQSFFDDLGFDHVEVYDSQHWHNGLCCLAYKQVKS